MARPNGGSDSRVERFYEPRVLEMLTFLTRRQSWLSPPEIAKTFRLGGKPVSVKTIYRWFVFLEEQAGLTYFPHPRMNLLNLQDAVVRVRGIRNPAILGIVPFAHSFFAEIGLSDGRPFLTQGYWVPGPSWNAFNEFWTTVKDLNLAEEVEVLPVRNTHFLFSPFHEVVTPGGGAKIPDRVDNEYFDSLVRRRLREPFEVRLGERIAASPLVIPIVLEHLWRHCSSRHVWQAIRAKGETDILRYGKGGEAKALRKKGAALRLLQQQWRRLMHHFDEVFLQPVVFFPPRLIQNGVLLSATLTAKSAESATDFAVRMSERSVLTAFMPQVGSGGKCRAWCNAPSDQLTGLLRLVSDSHRGPNQPLLGLIDVEATRELAQPAFGGFDWQSFDPATLSWRFDGESYIEHLKGLRAGPGVGLRKPSFAAKGSPAAS